MARLIVELIDKIPKGFIILCSDGLHTPEKSIMIPNNIYNWYKDADIYDSTSYILKSLSSPDICTEVYVTKLQKSMKIKFGEDTVSVPDKEFIKIYKAFCFQTFLDIKLFDGNSRIYDHSYRFLKNYDTRSKAFYFIDKFAIKFAYFYKRWFIDCNAVYDGLSNLEVFHGDVIYECEYKFKTRDGNGTAVYTFSIVSVEKG